MQPTPPEPTLILANQNEQFVVYLPHHGQSGQRWELRTPLLEEQSIIKLIDEDYEQIEPDDCFSRRKCHYHYYKIFKFLAEKVGSIDLEFVNGHCWTKGNNNSEQKRVFHVEIQ
ncbi:MAG: hypothetical protein EZS28_043827 [Streblomastix strix]|uniref:Proteinase inhibitor I42 chagasin domain-containing protein n=1 Tax=Streblomastix strix TaxID=222440 RepID=A0A5J4TQ93_9EUKA|nr:MAG: hypothetical protein EZS28_043827 [Streblomastix strix]